ncbi:MAG: hypothetical protein B7C55_13505 [Actinomycetales bacterium mxb001]|nr:MAG: hypothetical protein B7C55_13505 [Actinomycetales bacterium mxb001]
MSRPPWTGPDGVGGDGRLTLGDMVIDIGGREVYVDAQPVALTRTQFDLLVAMASAPGRVIRRDDLMEQVWGHTFFADPTTCRCTSTTSAVPSATPPIRPGSSRRCAAWATSSSRRAMRSHAWWSWNSTLTPCSWRSRPTSLSSAGIRTTSWATTSAWPAWTPLPVVRWSSTWRARAGSPARCPSSTAMGTAGPCSWS